MKLELLKLNNLIFYTPINTGDTVQLEMINVGEQIPKTVTPIVTQIFQQYFIAQVYSVQLIGQEDLNNGKIFLNHTGLYNYNLYVNDVIVDSGQINVFGTSISSVTVNEGNINTTIYSPFGVSGLSGMSGINGSSGIGIQSPYQNGLVTSDGSITGITAQSGITWDGNNLYINGSIQFNEIDTTPNPGKLTWDGIGLSVGMVGGNVNLQIGQEELVRVRNIDGTDLLDGEVVYLFGSTGDVVSVKRASNTGEYSSTRTLGVVTEPIINNQNGFVTTHGLVGGIDLRDFEEGDVLWLGEEPGSLTNVKPTAPNHSVFIGIVVRNTASGILYVNPQNGYELNELHDVQNYNPDTLLSGSTLIWNSVSKIWEPQVISTSLTVSEKDGSPSITTDNIIFPNNSISGITGGVLVNRFNGRRTITRSGFTGINPNTDDINEFLEAVFYPAVPPTLSLSATNTSRQFGSTTATTLTWTVTKQTRGISSITVNGNSITVPTTIDEDSDPFPTTVSNTVSASATQNVNTTFPMVISDSVGNTFNTSVTVSWFNKRYWGRSSNIVPNDATIISAVGGGSEFSTTRVQTRNGFDGAGNYLFFAWPSTFGTPTFTVNGLPNTAWTKQRSDTFVNSDGYSTTYDVWVSNTPQNSPLNIVVS